MSQDDTYLRDIFAGLAMQSILSWKDLENVNVSKEAYMMADLMLEARKPKKVKKNEKNQD